MPPVLFHTKPVAAFFAVQWTGDNFQEILDFAQRDVQRSLDPDVLLVVCKRAEQQSPFPWMQPERESETDAMAVWLALPKGFWLALTPQMSVAIVTPSLIADHVIIPPLPAEVGS